MKLPSTEIDPHLFTIIGVTGDLSRRYLLPALYRLSTNGVLKNKCHVLGVSRKKSMESGFRTWIANVFENAGLPTNEPATKYFCDKCVHYLSIGQGSTNDYRELAVQIKALENKLKLSGNRTFYLAIPPNTFPTAIEGLGKAGLNRGPGWTKIVVEKPFGQNLASSQELNRLIQHYFDESQIYRIDHFLGKETVQNLLVFRFANTIFESIWSRENIDSIEITVAEKIGVEKRANYDRIGALRDMVQNHLTQLLTLMAMEPPTTFEAGPIRHEKLKVLRQIQPIRQDDVVFGQYTGGKINSRVVLGYAEERGVSKDTQTETFVALMLRIANWRWQGVPFYLRTGKRMGQALTQIVVKLHPPPISLFPPVGTTTSIEPNIIIITIQPDDGFDIHFQVKNIGAPIALTTQKLHFRYSDVFGPIPSAYETLFLDIVTGDQTLFVRSDELDDAWRLYTPLLENNIPVRPYPAGTWGPREADKLLTRDGRKWANP